MPGCTEIIIHHSRGTSSASFRVDPSAAPAAMAEQRQEPIAREAFASVQGPRVLACARDPFRRRMDYYGWVLGTGSNE